MADSSIGNFPGIEPVVWHQWYPVATMDEVRRGVRYRTRVLDCDIEYGTDQEGVLTGHRCDAAGTPLRVQARYATFWISLGEPDETRFALPELDEGDRRILGLGSLQIHVSGLRAIENFLDMAHFPYVHGGLLGEEPHTDVAPYRVVVDRDNNEIRAEDCVFYQPVTSASATDGIQAHYTYRVVSPFSAILYKSSVSDLARRDVICLFVQPVSEEWCVGHFLTGCIDDVNTDAGLRLFQHTIVGQDLTILANHLPRRLPLDAGFEVPTKADAMSIAYRRWLRGQGVRYGTYTVPATAQVAA